MKPWQAVDVLWDKETITELRDGLINNRDSMLGQGLFEWAVPLSHTIAVLAHVIEEMEE